MSRHGEGSNTGVERITGSIRVSGRETCGFCLQTYRCETEVRCVACDRPLCVICAIIRFGRDAVFCPECRGDEE